MVEEAFKELEKRILGSETKGTGVEDVLKFLYDNQETIWWMSWEFVGKKTKDGRQLSHRAPARASDLAIHDPLLVEDRKIGKYKAYRMRSENVHLVEKRLGMADTDQPAMKRTFVYDPQRNCMVEKVVPV